MIEVFQDISMHLILDTNNESIDSDNWPTSYRNKTNKRLLKRKLDSWDRNSWTDKKGNKFLKALFQDFYP